MRNFLTTAISLFCVSVALTACGGGGDIVQDIAQSKAKSLDIQMLGSTDADVSAEKNSLDDNASTGT